MDTTSHHCPNCSAPLDVPIGETEAICEYCASRLKLVPEKEELEVVRTREEMKYRERVAVQKAILRKKLDQEEMERWRQTAAKVAIAALPMVGEVAGRAMFGAAIRRRGGGCAVVGCLAPLAALGMALLGALALFR